MSFRLPVLLGALSLALCAAEPDRSVLPLFAANCLECHSERVKTSGFSVSSLESVLAGGNKHGRAVVEGHPEKSPLLRMIKGELQPRMPLGKELAKADIDRIEEWIRKLQPSVQTTKSDYRWPFQKPAKGEPPAVKNTAWVRNPIDAFILAKLEETNLRPAPAAEKRTLARRVHLDLVGMPPSLEELDAFLKDESPEAYDKLIDRLLADKRYGERWGRHWLDLVRYGESSGLEGDGAIGNAWRYRDWVIDAFNANMAYDRFVIQQIAGGDEHSQTRNNYEPDVQGIVPTGFYRVAPWDRSNLVAADVRQNLLSEVTTATSSIFLGLTVGCARCHDHKYDPIPQKDYYRLQAFFQAVEAGGGRGRATDVPFRDKAFAARAAQKVSEIQTRLQNSPEKKEFDEYQAALLKKLIAGKKEQAKGRELTKADLRLELTARARGRRQAGGPAAAEGPAPRQRIFTPEEQEKHAQLFEDAERTGDQEEQAPLDAYEAELMKKLAAAYAKGDIDPLARFDNLTPAALQGEVNAKYSAKSILTEEEKNRYTELSGMQDILRRRMARWQPGVLGIVNVAGPPSGPDIAPTRILIRGDYRQPGEAVEPGFPSAITGNSEPATLISDRYRQFPTRGLRMTLAKWIASADNPLTARVMVNRMWQHHFGEGIVRTSSDFGKNGDRPSHPELVDWLAVRFMQSGWDVKAMHKLMLLSNTYRQSSENPLYKENSQDPDNRLLTHFNRRRLEAEAIRDGILWTSGRLNLEMGGPSVFPALPEDLADFARYGRTGALMWEPNEKEEDARRRSVYTFQRRSMPLPMMAAFDAIVFSESCARRSQTTTPLQALAMMNGALMHEESEQLARRIVKDVGEDRNAQVNRAFEMVLSRPPRSEELATFLRFDGSLDGICRVLLNSNEFLYLE